MSRRGATLSSLICSSVITFSIGCSGATLRTARVAAPASAAGSPAVWMTRLLPNTSAWAKGANSTGIRSASRPPSLVSPTTPTTVRQSPDTPMNLSTSPVQATRRPTAS